MLTGIRLPAQDFRRIAAGGPSGTAAELLRAGQHSRRVLRVLDAIGRLNGGVERPALVDPALDLLDRARNGPDRLRATLGHPSVGPWALECALGTAPVEHLASVAAAAGIRAGIEFRLTVPVLPRGVVLPGIGVLRVSAGLRTAVVEGGPGGWEVQVSGERHAVPTPGTREALKGGGAETSETAGPDAGEPILSGPWLTPAVLVLGGARLPRWRLTAEYADPYLALPPGAPAVRLAPLSQVSRDAVARAWELLVQRHRDRAEDITATLGLLIPLWPVAGSFANASRPDAFGAVWIDPAAPPRRIAAALVHELEHARLTALHDLAPLHNADPAFLHRVPWRSVPRPVHALLHGLYAHAAVIEFWRVESRTGDDEARREFDRYLGNARRALADYTDRSSLTGAGRQLVAAIQARIGVTGPI